jgi:hypothetical protein
MEDISCLKKAKAALCEIEIDLFVTDQLQLRFTKLISSLNEEIERLELESGETTKAQIEKIGKKFARKTINPVGLI